MASPILFKIFSSQFKTRAKVFFARVVPSGILDQDDLVSRMLKRGSTFSEADLRGAMLLYEEVVMQAVAEGYHVNTPLFNLRPSIKGTFKGLVDQFDPNRHSIDVSMSKGVDFSSNLRTASAKRTFVPDPCPKLLFYRDCNSDTRNGQLTAAGIGEIYGEELNFDTKNPACGVFFISETTGEATAVGVFSLVNPKRLMFLVPALAAGKYRLEVRKSYSQDAQIRTGTLVGADLELL